MKKVETLVNVWIEIHKWRELMWKQRQETNKNWWMWAATFNDVEATTRDKQELMNVSSYLQWCGSNDKKQTRTNECEQLPSMMWKQRQETNKNWWMWAATFNDVEATTKDKQELMNVSSYLQWCGSNDKRQTRTNECEQLPSMMWKQRQETNKN